MSTGIVGRQAITSRALSRGTLLFTERPYAWTQGKGLVKPICDACAVYITITDWTAQLIFVVGFFWIG